MLWNETGGADTARDALRLFRPDAIKNATLPYDKPARLAAAVQAFLKPAATSAKRIKTHNKFTSHATSCFHG